MSKAKFSRNIWLAALAVSLAFAAIALVNRQAVVANARAAVPSSVKPVKGVDVIVQKNPGGSASRTKTDAEGNATFSKLEPGQYKVRLECKECARSVAGEPSIDLTLTGTRGGDVKRTITKRQLVDGWEVEVSIATTQLRCGVRSRGVELNPND